MTGNNNMRIGKTSYSVNGKKYYSINYLLFIYDKEVLEQGKTVKEVLKKYKIKENSKEAYWLYDFDAGAKSLIAYKKALNASLAYKNAITTFIDASFILKKVIESYKYACYMINDIDVETTIKDVAAAQARIERLKILSEEWANFSDAYAMLLCYDYLYNSTKDENYLQEYNKWKATLDKSKLQMESKTYRLRDEAKAYGDYATLVMLKLI